MGCVWQVQDTTCETRSYFVALGWSNTHLWAPEAISPLFLPLVPTELLFLSIFYSYHLLFEPRWETQTIMYTWKMLQKNWGFVSSGPALNSHVIMRSAINVSLS